MLAGDEDSQEPKEKEGTTDKGNHMEKSEGTDSAKKGGKNVPTNLQREKQTKKKDASAAVK